MFCSAADQGKDSDARQSARDGMRYSTPVQLVQRLHQDHEARSQAWRLIRDDLQAVSEGDGHLASLVQARVRWRQFAELYADPVRAEEDEDYPAARGLPEAPALEHMGQETPVRRGVAGAR